MPPPPPPLLPPPPLPPPPPPPPHSSLLFPASQALPIPSSAIPISPPPHSCSAPPHTPRAAHGHRRHDAGAVRAADHMGGCECCVACALKNSCVSLVAAFVCPYIATLTTVTRLAEPVAEVIKVSRLRCWVHWQSLPHSSCDQVTGSRHPQFRWELPALNDLQPQTPFCCFLKTS